MKKLFSKNFIKISLSFILALGALGGILYYIIKLKTHDVPIQTENQVEEPINPQEPLEERDFLNGNTDTKIELTNYDKMIVIIKGKNQFQFDLNMFKLIFFQKFNKLLPLNKEKINLEYSKNDLLTPTKIMVKKMKHFEDIKKALIEKGAKGSITKESNFRDLGIDSLDLMDLVLALEDKLSITISDDELMAMKAIEDLLKFTIEDYLNYFKKQKMKVTEMRYAILEAVLELDHFTVNDLIAYLKKKFKTINIMTVYNNIDTLLEHNLLFASTFNGKIITYEAMSPTVCHISCDYCNKITHLPVEKFLSNILTDFNEIADKNDIKMEHFKIEIHGDKMEKRESDRRDFKKEDRRDDRRDDGRDRDRGRGGFGGGDRGRSSFGGGDRGRGGFGGGDRGRGSFGGNRGGFGGNRDRGPRREGPSFGERIEALEKQVSELQEIIKKQNKTTPEVNTEINE
ncbi:hypothetical protein FQR65_LT17088 [Abscondita terminalis]|nr:hypothetical protein FQR65_LT17088 [Abscondita terminalis]